MENTGEQSQPIAKKLTLAHEELLLKSPNFRVITGHIVNEQRDLTGQRIFVVPKTREAESELKKFAEENKRDPVQLPFGGEEETISAMSYTGPTDLFLDILESRKGRPAGMNSYGVPSLQALEAKLPQKPAEK